MMLDKLKELLVQEPVRVYLYGVVVAVVALLVGAGVVTAGVAPLLLAVAAALLGVPAVEMARSKVTPVAKLAMECCVDECDNCPYDNCEDCAYRVP